MNSSPTSRTSRPSRAARLAVPLIALVATAGLALVAGGAQAAAVPVPLGTTESFVVLAGAGVTNTGPTVLVGDIGTFPTTSISGANEMTITGTDHAGDAVTQQAKTDLVVAYDAAAGQGPVQAVPVELGNQVLSPGVYSSGGELQLTGTVTLDAQDDPDAVFVFQTPSTLVTATDSVVELINGASACNVYWQVTSSATLGARTQFAGTVLALTTITLDTQATVLGRVLARNGEVTLRSNTITRPVCTAVPTATPTATVTPTATPTPTATATTAPQVGTVPRGGVATGDGSSIPPTGPSGGALAVAAVAGLGLIAWFTNATLRARRARRTI